MRTLNLQTNITGNTVRRPRLAIVLGDPAGIGTEVVLKALGDRALREACEMTLIGNRTLLHQTYQHLRQTDAAQSEAAQANSAPLANPEDLHLHNLPLPSSVIEQIRLGTESAASGAASFQFLEAAIDLTLDGQFDGIVTAPIAKSAWNAAGHHYPGQTEVLAKKAGASRYGMLFVARSPLSGWTLRTLLATTHIPLCQVPEALTADLLTRKLELLIDCLAQDFGIEHPRIAIAGLNPHSGEQGQLGREEQDSLFPWLQQMVDCFPQVKLEGLIPPDTMWVRPGQAWYGSATPEQAHDGYLALYHDQGLIPVKLLAFDRAVNTTIGLPFVRTSPDHGTAFDIAGKGIAQSTSFRAAIELAIELTQQRIAQ